MSNHTGHSPTVVSARFSPASALWRAFILGGWMWVPLVLGLAHRWQSHPDEPLIPLYADGLTKTEWTLERYWWLAALLVALGVVVPLYHLSKLFRRSPRLVLDEEGVRGPMVPGRFIKWSAVRSIRMSSGQRAGICYATWELDLQDGRTVAVRGLATLDIPDSDLFQCARGVLETGSLKPPPKRFWSRLWT